MNFFDINFTLFNFFGTNVSLLETLSVFFGLFCVFLAGRGKIINYWFGYIYTLLLFFLFMQKHLYSSMLLQPISLAIAIFGHYRWAHPREGEHNKQHQLKITILSWKERFMSLGVVVLFMIFWGLLMARLPIIWPEIFSPATRPYLDAFVVGMIMLAQYLSAQKKIDCWGAWIIINITNITLHTLAGLAFMPLIGVAYFILAFFGIASWRKQWREQ